MKQQLSINKNSPKKSLGQNFIKDKSFMLKLSSLILSDKQTNIFEIGPGMGALTSHLAKKEFKTLFLIEKDIRFFEELNNEFKDNNKINIINCDALSYDYEIANKKNKSMIVGNLPFNISTQLLIKWIAGEQWPPYYSKMVLMFQKEVADRIISLPNQKSYSRISVITQARCNVRKILNAPSGIFFPKPKVDGAVLEFTPILKNKNMNILNLQVLVKKSFEHRRKKIKTTLKDYSELLKILKIDDSLRAEDLSVEDYCKLASAI